MDNIRLIAPAIAIRFISIYLLLAIVSFHLKSETIESNYSKPGNETPRIVSLSPHLTELVYLLGQGEHLIAVSDFSDYPIQALSLPRVASYQGANIPAILRLNPTHILAWRGGNKDADISKLIDNGLPVYQSNIHDLDSLLSDIKSIALFLNVGARGQVLTQSIQAKLKKLQQNYVNQNKTVFYYLNDLPLVALGNDTWLNDLLSQCGLRNVFANSLAAYPQVSLAQVLRHQPDVLIAATNKDKQTLLLKWAEHTDALKAHFIQGNPDKLHRFTPRAVDEIAIICQQVYTNLSVASKVSTNK